MARKKKQKPTWPPVVYMTDKLVGFKDADKLRRIAAPVEPYVSLTALNELLAARGVDKIKIVDE